MTAAATTPDPDRAADTPDGEIITFYSYKGGTGRTMALANVACLLARRNPQDRVLIVDWDLEAPGLHHYFAAKLTQAFGTGKGAETALMRAPGLAELASELGKRTANLAAYDPPRAASAQDGDDAEPSRDPADAADRLVAGVDLASHVIATDIPGIALLKAGRFDAKYAANLSAKLKWEAWYRRCPELFPALARRWRRKYRWVLIDARTGSTDTTGICTMLMPDKLVVVFTPNRQSLVGITDLTRRAVAWRTRYGEARPLMVYPLPSRIDSERESLRQQWREGDKQQGIEGYQPMFEAALASAHGLAECKLQAYFNEVQVQHSPDYAFGERIAVDETMPTSDDRFSVARSYEALLAWLADGIPPWENREHWQGLVELMQLDERIDALVDATEPLARQERAQALLLRVGVAARVHGTDAPETLAARNAHALDLAARGQRKEALAVQEQAVDALRTVADERTVKALGQLVELALSVGAIDTAVEAAREQAALAASVHGSGAIETLRAHAQLGYALSGAGALDESRAQLDLARVGLADQLGEADPVVLTIQSRLAAVLHAQGRLDEAQAMQMAVLAAQHRVLGPEHPNTLASMTSMADILIERGDPDQARSLLDEVIARRLRTDTEGPDVDLARGKLAHVLAELGQLQQAVALCQSVLEHQRARLGEAHPNTIASMVTLAQLLGRGGQFSAARSLEERALSLSTKSLGPDHPSTLALEMQLANTLLALGDLSAAREWLERLLEQAQRVFRPEHPQTILVMLQLARLYASRRELGPAQALVNDAIALCQRANPPAPDHLLPALELTAGELEMMRGDAPQAWAHYGPAIDTMRAKFGPYDDRTVLAVLQAAPVLQTLGRHDDVIALLADARTQRDKDDEISAQIDQTLAITYARMGRHPDAIVLLTQGLTRLAERFGDGSNELVSRYELLATLAKEAGDRDAESHWKDAVIDALKASRERRASTTPSSTPQPR